jgi:two-component system CheB/CheR fusion protein
MNEELQSTNEELQTMNDELRQRSREVEELNAFLEAVFTSVRTAVVVVDLDFTVRVWNLHAEELWGLRADEVRDRNLLNLDIGLPVDRLREPIKDCMGQGAPVADVSVTGHNRRGRQVDCTIAVTPLLDQAGAVHGALLVIDEAAAG